MDNQLDIIKQQNANSVELQRAITNYKKCPIERKKVDYLEEKLQKITELWEKFNKTDRVIRNNPNIPDTHEYYKHFEIIGQLYNSTIEKLEEEIKVAKTVVSFEKPEETGASTSQLNERSTSTFSTNTTMHPSGITNSLALKQQKGISAVKALLEEMHTDTTKHSKEFYQMKLNAVERRWQMVKQLNEQLWSTYNDEHDINEMFKHEDEINESILMYKERINTTMYENINEEDKLYHETKNTTKLPNIELPTFDGNYVKWRQYRDLFEEMVHKQNISGCQKLWYLKSSLSGEAARLIQHITLTSDNYNVAWQIIHNRYENKRLLVGSLLQKLLTQPSTYANSAASIKSLHDTTSECLLGIQTLGINVNDWDPILLHILTQQLDRQTQLLWEQSLVNPREIPCIKEFLKFLELRFQSMEAVIAQRKPQQQPSNALVATTNQCAACMQDHGIYQCTKFLNMSVQQRQKLVQTSKLCNNCLKNGHNAKKCPSRKNCQKCDKRHNTLLHFDNKKVYNKEQNQSNKIKSSLSVQHPTSSTNIPVTSTSTAATSLAALPNVKNTAVILSTVLLKVKDDYGNEVNCRAVLDNGSQVHLMTQNFANKLGIKSYAHYLNIQGIGETQRRATRRINVQLFSRVTTFTTNIDAQILPKIVSQQPSHYINVENWNIPENIQLADPQFNVPNDIDLLIGAGIFYQILSIGQIKLGNQLPILQNSLFGWIIGGEHAATEQVNSTTCAMLTEQELYKSMEKFWEVEEGFITPRQMTAAEMKCERHFLETTRRDKDGRFIVSLPFQEDPGTLGRSYDIALQRLLAIERRLFRDENLRIEYTKFMREYENLGHMEEIPLNSVLKPQYFMPHHAVIKPESTTTKVRVVFDASAQTTNKISLNDILAVGPNIQDDVFTQLLRFRLPRYAFTTDIEKMYRQIWVHNDDRKFQLILWREDPSKPIRCFKLKTITYGTASAPYLAIRCLRQIAEDCQQQFPEIASILNKNCYVDDVLAGTDNFKLAVDMVHSLRRILGQYGFNLRKWCANDQRLLKDIPEQDQELNLELSQKEHIKTMGLIWQPKEDMFLLKVEVQETIHMTKRNILADISKIFDPLGFIAPVTVKAKIFLQKLWKLKWDWDTALPEEVQKEWNSFRKEFYQLQSIKIPRHVYNHQRVHHQEIHIFADASEKAYGAVAYMRSITVEKTIIVRFLCAKSKVAPTKQITLPRMELCAAKLAADLMHRIQQDLEVDKTIFHLWSDSNAVLGWINAESSNYHTFIANRIAAIQRISLNNQWHHVSSVDNPADIISRGLNPNEIIENNFWFYGPRMLHSSTSTWKNQPNSLPTCLLEQRTKRTATMTTTLADDTFTQINHGNCFRKLQRIIAYCLRFSKPKIYGQLREIKASLVLRPEELEEALRKIIKNIQKCEFSDDIQKIMKYGTVENNSSLSHLAPFIDTHGILRVGGRLEATSLTYEAKHPALLSHKHEFTKLLMTQIHKENMHAGTQTLMAISRQKFWITHAKTLARNIIHNCVLCTRMKPKMSQQIMAQLPKDRVTAFRPFLITGVDFFGPIYVHFKTRGKRPQKVYGCVFCCFSTKAVHMEIVSDLSTDAFIGALKRFIGRRGRCQKIYCDNATNFVGAQKLLDEFNKIIHTDDSQTKIKNECSKYNIEFCFIPPRAPHFGGLWEAAVKSAKGLLKSTLAAASLTYEEMETILIDAEAILNSRPITPISSDPNDMTALTPGHFLIGEPLTSLADPYAKEEKISCRNRWKIVTHLKMEFWRRWTHEYLQQLQHRYKWNNHQQNLSPGTMVIIKDDNLPPLKWVLGRIERTIEGPDGKVRVADVRTQNNILRRPIHKLAVLPIEEENTEDRPTNSIKENHTSRPQKRKSTSSLAILLVTCLLLPLAVCSSIEVRPFMEDPGIYYEQVGMAGVITSNWNLVNYFDMKPYITQLNSLYEYTSKLSELCGILRDQSSCEETNRLIYKRLKLLKENNEFLQASHRNKRGAFNFIGSIANGLFGLLDTEYADRLAASIEIIQQNEQTLKRHAENQTTYMDRTLAIMKRNEKEVAQEFEIMEDVIQNLTSSVFIIGQEINSQRVYTKFNEFALQAFMHISDYQNMQDALFDIITDAHHGKIHTELLSPKELALELENIDPNLMKTTMLPLPTTDIAQFYRLMTISHRITRNYIIFSIKLPLITSKRYELLKLTAIPWIKNDTFYQLQLSTPYLMIDLLRDMYYMISNEEREHCFSIDGRLFLCHPSQPLNNQQSLIGQCEFNILKEARLTSYCHSTKIGSGPYWLPLLEENTWIFAVHKTEPLNIVCNNNPSQQKLIGTGILKIGQNCVIKTPAMIIEGHKSIATVRHISYLPNCNISNLEVEPQYYHSNYTTSYQNHHAEINQLKNELDQFKIVSLNTVRSHDIHHYGLGYTILAILICASVITLILRLKRKCIKVKTPQPAPRCNMVQDDEPHIISMFNS